MLIFYINLGGCGKVPRSRRMKICCLSCTWSGKSAEGDAHEAGGAADPPEQVIPKGPHWWLGCSGWVKFRNFWRLCLGHPFLRFLATNWEVFAGFCCFSSGFIMITLHPEQWQGFSIDSSDVRCPLNVRVHKEKWVDTKKTMSRKMMSIESMFLQG